MKGDFGYMRRGLACHEGKVRPVVSTGCAAGNAVGPLKEDFRGDKVSCNLINVIIVET